MIPRSKGVIPRYRRTTFRCRGGCGTFRKEIWEELVPNEKEVVVVFYHGVDTDFKLSSHGNSTTSDRIFRRTPSSFLQELKESQGTAKTVYNQQCLKGFWLLSMTLPEFFGCTLISFGPPVVMFITTVARDPLKVIVMTASAFFWLISLLLSSLLWYAVLPLRNQLAFGLVFSIIFQELMRFCFYRLLKMADDGLKKMATSGESGPNNSTILNPHTVAYVSGLGFGIMAGAFAHFNTLAIMTGPGTVGIDGNPQNFFLISSFFTLCFVLLHTFWGIIFFAAMDRKSYIQVVLVVVVHATVSSLTLINPMANATYPQITLGIAYVALVGCIIWAFLLAGGNPKGFICCKKDNQRS